MKKKLWEKFWEEQKKKYHCRILDLKAGKETIYTQKTPQAKYIRELGEERTYQYEIGRGRVFGETVFRRELTMWSVLWGIKCKIRGGSTYCRKIFRHPEETTTKVACPESYFWTNHDRFSFYEIFVFNCIVYISPILVILLKTLFPNWEPWVSFMYRIKILSEVLIVIKLGNCGHCVRKQRGHSLCSYRGLIYYHFELIVTWTDILFLFSPLFPIFLTRSKWALGLSGRSSFFGKFWPLNPVQILEQQENSCRSAY